MNHRDLLNKLLQIEQAIGVESNFTIHEMLMDAENCLLRLEKERIEELSRNAGVSVLSGYRPETSSFILRSESGDSAPATVGFQAPEST